MSHPPGGHPPSQKNFKSPILSHSSNTIISAIKSQSTLYLENKEILSIFFVAVNKPENKLAIRILEIFTFANVLSGII